MGGGNWDSDRYDHDTRVRASKGIADFDYGRTASEIHPDLDPKRINSKPFGKLESRDSGEHPESNAILVGFDVTGSNKERAVDAQKALKDLMTLTAKYIPHPQVAVAANDDYNVEPYWVIQASDFESDNRVDEHLRNIKLVGNGGGNGGESYDLLLYLAARKTVLDCVEKRGRKGYLFLYADEPMFDRVSKSEVKAVFGDSIESDIPIEDIIEEAREMYHVFILWPRGGYSNAREQFVDLFGDEYVVTLQHPNMICQQICGIIGVNEAAVTTTEVVDDLVSVGVDPRTAKDISQALVPLSKSKGVVKLPGGLPQVSSKGKTGASRL